jgi:hypothetical protein
MSLCAGARATICAVSPSRRICYPAPDFDLVLLVHFPARHSNRIGSFELNFAFACRQAKQNHSKFQRIYSINLLETTRTMATPLYFSEQTWGWPDYGRQFYTELCRS